MGISLDLISRQAPELLGQLWNLDRELGEVPIEEVDMVRQRPDLLQRPLVSCPEGLQRWRPGVLRLDQPSGDQGTRQPGWAAGG